MNVYWFFIILFALLAVGTILSKFMDQHHERKMAELGYHKTEVDHEGFDEDPDPPSIDHFSVIDGKEAR